MILQNRIMNYAELAWWRISLDQVRSATFANMAQPVAITINGANRQEAVLIKRWCKELPLYLRKTAYFDDSFIINREDGTGFQLNYTNNERIAVGEEQDIIKLEKLLKTLPVRCYEVILEEFDLQIVKEIVKGYNNRIISDLHQQNHLVSFDNKELRMELILRSSNWEK